MAERDDRDTWLVGRCDVHQLVEVVEEGLGAARPQPPRSRAVGGASMATVVHGEGAVASGVQRGGEPLVPAGVLARPVGDDDACLGTGDGEPTMVDVDAVAISERADSHQTTLDSWPCQYRSRSRRL